MSTVTADLLRSVTCGQAVARIPATPHKAAAKTTKTVTKKVVKKRRRLSPQSRAKLAKNLVKARAARARTLKAAKTAAKKLVRKVVRNKPAKKSVKRAVKRR